MRWNLDKLYPSFDSEKFMSDLKKLDEDLDNFERWAEETLKQKSVKELPQETASELMTVYIDSRISVMSLFSKLYSFSELTFSVDASNSMAKKYTEILEQKLPKITKINVLFTRWLSAAENPDTLIKLIKNSGKLNEHRFFFNEILTKSTHLLSDEEELLAAKLKTSGSDAWASLWNVLTSTVLVDIELNGEKKSLPLPVVRNMANSPDAEARKTAFEAELKAYEKFDKSAAAALNSIKGEVITMAEARGYDSPLALTLENSRMDRETLDAMLMAMKEYFPVFRKYLKRKSRLLGHSKGLPFYDLFAPVGSTAMEFSFEEARDFVVSNFGRFSKALAQYAENAFKQNWIDAEQREGKRGGAFCSNLHPIKESRIMTNFDGSFSSVTTLAHELGHGYHGHCLKDESYLNADYPMPLAETASIFCETLIIQAALKKADDKQKITILENSLQSDTQVIVDIYSRFLFESEVFERRKEAPLSVEELKEIMTKAQKESYGEGLDESSLHPYMWACKPHYYYADYNFYNFPYAFGLLFARGLYAEYLKRGRSFIKEYDELLRETGKNSVYGTAKMAGIDVRDPNFWRSSLDTISGEIAEFLELADSRK